MAILARFNKPKIDKSNTTIIAAGTKITGQIEIQCKLHVDGEFTGRLRSDSLITIGKSGQIEGDVAAKKLVVTGGFKGNADCDEIEILSAGQVSGEIQSKVLVIERGSFFEGESRLKDPNTYRDQGSSRLLIAGEEADSSELEESAALEADAPTSGNVTDFSELSKSKDRREASS